MIHSLKEICDRIGIRYEGEDRSMSGLAALSEAGSGDLSFFHNEKYRKDLPHTGAAAVLIEEKYAGELPENTLAIITEEPYLKLAMATEIFVHPLSVGGTPPAIGDGSTIDSSVCFGKNVVVGKGTTIMAGTYIGDDCIIGDNCLIHPNVSIYHGCRIGDGCIIHSGAVIGSDGYGFAHTRDGRHVKIHQIGRVVIGDDVEIGANTTVDRGALGDTVIGNGTKIDNQVQVGHNCIVGENCLIVAQVGMAGSTISGRNVILGGQSATAGHLEIGDFATFAARSGVTKSLPGSMVYGGAPAVEIRLWKKMQAAIMRLVKKR